MELCGLIQPWTLAVGGICIAMGVLCIDTWLLNRPRGVSLIGVADFKLFKRRHDPRVFKAMSEVERRDGVWVRKCLEIQTHKVIWLDAAQLVMLLK
jgi:hypothetical protein